MAGIRKLHTSANNGHSAMTSHKDLAMHLLKADKQARSAFINMIYDAVK